MLSNQAGGPGVVHGLDCSLGASDRLDLGRGMAIDPDGRLLLLPDPAAISVAALLEAARGDPDPVPAAKKGKPQFAACEPVRVQPPGVAVQGVELWLLTLAHAEAACGTEDVFGNPCESACTSSTDRPYLVEGVLLRAVPLILDSPLPTASAVALTQLHLRSRIAAAYFADDRRRCSSLISGAGLRADAWCLGSRLAGGNAVPLAILARLGTETLFLDPWIPRRERIDPPPRQYWAGRMAMRPWSGFLAEVLQFQCHLRDILAEDPKVGPSDPCARTRASLRRTSDELRRLFSHYSAISKRLVDGLPGSQDDLENGLSQLESLQRDLDADNKRDAVEPLDRILIHNGIVELPAAGYLPVVPGRDPSVELQVRRWLGDGVDLRFCTVRPDFVAHALEEVQHMDRISLLAGLDDPKARPELDILVPDGQLVTPSRGVGVEFIAECAFNSRPGPTNGFILTIHLPAQHSTATATGAGRAERLPNGGAALHLAGQLTPGKPRTAPAPRPLDPENDDRPVPSEVSDIPDPSEADRNRPLTLAQPTGPALHLSDMRGFLSATIDAHPADAARGDRIPLHVRLVATHQSPTGAPQLLDLDIDGSLHILAVGPRIRAEILYAINGAPAVIQPLELAWKSAPPGLIAAEVKLQRADLTLELSLQWSPGDPRQVTATLVATSAVTSTTTTIATTTVTTVQSRQLHTDIRARLDHNNAVLEPTSPQHAAVLEVVDDIARAHDDKHFKREALALLFPPLRPRTELVATRDWVLFHRRRTRQCIATPLPTPLRPRPAPVALRTYRIHVATPGEFPRTPTGNLDLKALPDALANGILDLRRLHALGTARFRANSDDMLEQDVAPLQTAWQQIPPKFILDAAFTHSTRSPQDGEPRIAAQTRDVGTKLDPSRPEAPALPVHLLQQPPHDYPLDDIDGVILLIGHQRIANTKSTVYWVDPPHFPKLQQGPDLATFLKHSKSTNIGTVTFATETDTLVDSDPTALQIALSAIPTFKAGRPLLVHAFCDSSHPDADLLLLKKRVWSLVKALQLSQLPITSAEQLRPRAALPGANPMIILLSARPGVA
jgi:hypothetical protein